jgi:putative protease
MEIINDLSKLFDGFMIDLTNIGAGDKESPDKAALIKQFEQLLRTNNSGLSEKTTVESAINKIVPESTCIQYHNGL